MYIQNHYSVIIHGAFQTESCEISFMVRETKPGGNRLLELSVAGNGMVGRFAAIFFYILFHIKLSNPLPTSFYVHIPDSGFSNATVENC